MHSKATPSSDNFVPHQYVHLYGPYIQSVSVCACRPPRSIVLVGEAKGPPFDKGSDKALTGGPRLERQQSGKEKGAE